MIPQLTQLLADTNPDPMISGNWIIAVIGAIAAGIALVIGKKQGRAEAEDNNVTIKQPVPTVPMSKVTTPPSWDAHRALCDRVLRLEEDMKTLHGEVKAVRTDQNEQFRQLMMAGAEREIRISEKIEGFARAIHNRIDEYLKHPPTPHRRGS